MKREEQYRYGVFPPKDPIPQWIRDRVAELEDQVEQLPEWTLMEAEQIICRLRDNALPKLRATELLHWSDERGSDGLLRHTQQRVDADPTNQQDYWDAMWTIRHYLDDERAFEKLMPAYADALEVQARHRELGWPDAWTSDMCALWTEVQGTTASARAWASAQWSPADVLTQPIALHGRPMTLLERVTTQRVPHRDEHHFTPVRKSRTMCVHNHAPRGTR